MMNQVKSKVNFKLLRYNLLNLRAYLVIYSIFFFSVGPFPVILNFIRNNAFDPYSGSASLPFFLIIFASLAFLITPFIVFSYLNSKKSVDVYHALPIKRNDLFVTQVLTSFLVTYIPFILNYLLTYLSYTVSKVPYSNNYLNLLAFITVLLFSVQMISTFVIHNTGTTSDSLVHTGIMIALPFVFIGAGNLFVQTYMFGFKGISWNVLNYITPFFPLFDSFRSSYKVSSSLFLYWTLMNVLLFLLIMHLYRLRKSEKSDEPFVNDTYFPIVLNLFIPLSFIVLNALNISYGSIKTIRDFFSFEAFLLPVLLSFVAYSILNILRYRSTKYFLKSCFDFIKVMFVTVVIGSILITTNMFGLTWRLPDAKDVESISFKPSNIAQINPTLVSGKSPYSYNTVVELVDPDAIASFIEIHKEVNNNVRTNRSDTEKLIKDSIIGAPLKCEVSEQEVFEFTYKMRDGNIIERSMTLPREVLLSFGKLLANDNYQIVMNPILNTDVKPINITLYNNIADQRANLGSNPEFVEKLRTAYLSDISNMTPQDILFKGSNLKYILEYTVDVRSFKSNTQGVNFNTALGSDINGINHLFIDDRYANTLALLDTYKFTQEEERVYHLIPTTDHYYDTESMCGAIITDSYYNDKGIIYDVIDVRDVIDNIDDYRGKVQGNHIRDTKGEVLIFDGYSLPIAP